MKKKESKAEKKALIVTEKQLQVIKEACELYGRIQIGQFRMFAEIITQTGFSGWQMRVNPEKKEDESTERYNDRVDELECMDKIVCDSIEGAMEGIYRHAYRWDGKPRTNEADVALDIWAKLDGRREDTDFSMSTEPLVQVKEWEEK